MCDGCNGTVRLTRRADNKQIPLHQSTRSKRLFVFRTFPKFEIEYVRLAEGTGHE